MNAKLELGLLAVGVAVTVIGSIVMKDSPRDVMTPTHAPAPRLHSVCPKCEDSELNQREPVIRYQGTDSTLDNRANW